MQSRRPGESVEMMCHVTGEPRPFVAWLKNDEPINGDADGENRIQVIGNGTALLIRNATYADTGSYACRASNVGGVTQELSSLIVQDEPVPSECFV